MAKDKNGKGESPAKAERLDFSKVRDRNFNVKHVPPGDYLLTISKVVNTTSKAGNKQWLFTLTGKTGAVKGAQYPYYCGKDSDNLWKVRNLAIAAGYNIPKEVITFDPNKLVGRDVGATMDDDEYEGKLKSVIAAVMPPSDIEDLSDEDATDEDEEVSSNGNNGKAKKQKKELAAAGAKKGKKGKLESIDLEEI